MQSTIRPPRPTSHLSRRGVVACLEAFAYLIGILLVGHTACRGQGLSALTVSLRLPAAVAYDAQGKLYLAETGAHVVRRLDLTGALTTVAGNGTQGFSGDGGPATAAALDSPSGVAVDGAGNLYIADTHNQRLRRVDAVTGIITTYAGGKAAGFSGDGGPAVAARLNLPLALALDAAGNLYIADSGNHRIRRVSAATSVIATVAGNGVQGFGGDGGSATAAAIDTPSGLAIDGAGNLYVSDTHNHRVRVVSAATGRMATLAGTGTAGFGGDHAAASSARFALPQGLSVDPAGNVFVADTNNHRVRRIAADGTITTVAGTGSEAYTGDGGPASAANLDTPRGTALTPNGLLTIADTGNERARQMELGGAVATLAGQAPAGAGTLALTLPLQVSYGTGSVTATLASVAPATGRVTFFERTASGTSVLGSAPLTAGAARLSTAAISAGTHQIYSTYSGDLAHAGAQSTTGQLTVVPCPVTAAVPPAAILYGQVVPTPVGVLQGLLPQDQGRVSLTLSTSAAALSPAGTYPITGALAGAAAIDYVLAPIAAAVTIARAPTTLILNAPSASAGVGLPVHVSIEIVSTTTGTPTGNVTVLDGGIILATLPISSAGSAMMTTSSLASGQHQLTAVYAGDTNFVGSSTARPTLLEVPPVTPGDFALVPSGPVSLVVPSGSMASFNFAVQMEGTALASPILLSAGALPTGMSATFTPGSLPPGGTVTAFILTIQTQKKAAMAMGRSIATGAATAVVLMLLPLGLRKRSLPLWGAALALVGVIAGCGSGINSQAATGASSYAIVVSATAQSPTGVALLHTATVTLGVQ